MTDYKFTPDEIPSMSNFNKRFEGLNTLNADLYSHYWNKYEISFEDFADGSTADAVAINPPIRLLTDRQPAPSIVDGKFDFSGATTYSPVSGSSVDLFIGYKFATGEEKGDTYYEASASGNIYNNNQRYVINPAAKIHRIKPTIGALVGVVKSDNLNAYPKGGFSGGYYYEYLGSPFENAQIAAKIDKGSYTGTGTFGSSNPNSITFEKGIPYLVVITTSGSVSGQIIGLFVPKTLPNSYVKGSYRMLSDNSVTSSDMYSKVDGNTLYWYSTAMNFQLNTKDTYDYYAFY